MYKYFNKIILIFSNLLDKFCKRTLHFKLSPFGLISFAKFNSNSGLVSVIFGYEA